MNGLMMNSQLTLTSLLERAARLFGGKEIACTYQRVAEMNVARVSRFRETGLQGISMAQTAVCCCARQNDGFHVARGIMAVESSRRDQAHRKGRLDIATPTG